MASEDVRIFLIDPAGADLGTYRIAYAAPLRVGQEVWLALDGARALYRVVRERQAETGERLVHVIAVPLRCPFCRTRLLAGGPAALLHDDEGDFVVCPTCDRRVAMERLPTTPPGGPVRLRVAPDQ
jgi:hypothetical protein